MKKVKFYVSTPYVGSKYEEIIEVHEDDCGEESLAEMGRDWIWDTINYGWEVIDEDKKIK